MSSQQQMALAPEPADRGGLPFASRVLPSLMKLLRRWFEWRTVAGAPRTVRLPSPTMRWSLTRRGVVGRPEVCLAVSTAPKGPGRLHDFNLAFWSLPQEQRFYILVYLTLEKETWLTSQAWRDSLRLLEVTSRQFERLLESALLELEILARNRGTM